MKQLKWGVVGAALLVCVVNGPRYAAAGSSLGSECKNSFAVAKEEIKGISDPTRKQQATTLEKGAFTDLKSGEYQNCLDKLKQIKTLAQW
jgi:hypothetical protein